MSTARELSLVQKARFIQPGKEDKVFRLHGQVLGSVASRLIVDGWGVFIEIFHGCDVVCSGDFPYSDTMSEVVFLVHWNGTQWRSYETGSFREKSDHPDFEICYHATLESALRRARRVVQKYAGGRKPRPGWQKLFSESLIPLASPFPSRWEVEAEREDVGIAKVLMALTVDERYEFEDLQHGDFEPYYE